MAAEPRNPLQELIAAEPFESKLFFHSRAGRIVLAIIGWTVIAVIGTTTAYIAFQGERFDQWLNTFQPMIIYYYLWAGITVVLYQFVTRVRFTPARAPWIALAHLGFLTLITLAMPFLVHGAQWRAWLLGERAVGFHLLGLFIYLFVLIACLLLVSYRQGRARELQARAAALRAAMLENQLSEAKIDVLKTQINPHFLFNALNSIAALIETAENQQAYRAVELLGGLMRSTLEQSRNDLVPLGKELEFVRRYIELEKIRFGDRLNYSIRTGEGESDTPVPSLLLQPLVENAIKHAVARSSTPVSVNIDVTRRAQGLVIKVSDDGPGLGPGYADSEGLGLQNIRQRLELLYGKQFSFRLRDRAPRGAEVELILP